MPLSDNNTYHSDIERFERLFKEYYAPLCRYAYSIVRDADQAEEIVQEFFYSYWNNRNRLSIRISLKSYLFRSIRNRAVRFLQHKKVEEQYREHSRISAFFDSPEQIFNGNEMAELVEKTLEELPDRCRQVFLLNRVNGLKYKEIAELLKVSVKTVESDMGKALLAFRTNLAHAGFSGK